jgi:hypothetical protein
MHSILVNFLPGWLELLFLVCWAVTIVLLIMDDREPSITVARQGIAAFVSDMENCREVTLDDVLSVRRLKRLRNQASRLFSNVL